MGYQHLQDRRVFRKPPIDGHHVHHLPGIISTVTLFPLDLRDLKEAVILSVLMMDLLP